MKGMPISKRQDLQTTGLVGETDCYLVNTMPRRLQRPVYADTTSTVLAHTSPFVVAFKRKFKRVLDLVDF
jgi:hypothetical protein